MADKFDHLRRAFDARLNSKPDADPAGLLQSMLDNSNLPYRSVFLSATPQERRALVRSLVGGDLHAAMRRAQSANPKASARDIFNRFTAPGAVFYDQLHGLDRKTRADIINQYLHNNTQNDKTFLGIGVGSKKNEHMHDNVDKLGAYYELLRRSDAESRANPRIAARKMHTLYKPLWDKLTDSERALFTRKYVLGDIRGNLDKTNILTRYNPSSSAGARALVRANAKANGHRWGTEGALGLNNYVTGLYNGFVSLPTLGNSLVDLPLSFAEYATDANSITGKVVRAAANANRYPIKLVDKIKIHQQFDDDIRGAANTAEDKRGWDKVKAVAGDVTQLENLASFSQNSLPMLAGELAAFKGGFGRVPGVLTTAYKAVRHPVNTAKNVYGVVRHPVNTARNVAGTVKNAVLPPSTATKAAKGGTPTKTPKTTNGAKSTKGATIPTSNRNSGRLTKADWLYGALAATSAAAPSSERPSNEDQALSILQTEGVLPIGNPQPAASQASTGSTGNKQDKQDKQDNQATTNLPNISNTLAFDSRDPVSWGLRGGGAVAGAALANSLARKNGGKVPWWVPSLGAAAGYLAGSGIDTVRKG